ncbi:MAG: YciI family protein [Ectothiorhodospiraceae bacterium]|nr:YciI family protein [Ectothiorhodospiraceae bacterium]
MRFMIIVKGDEKVEAGAMPDPAAVAEMADYHEELQRAGVLVDASGLQPSAKGFRIRYRGTDRQVVDGPFTETKELVGGYTIIRVPSREEAVKWALRFPNPRGSGEDCEIEVRQMFELDDFEPGEAIERFRKMGVGGA